VYTDKELVCADCGQPFVFSASEQDFYNQRSFTEPKRCSNCRAARKAARGESGGGYSDRNGESSYNRSSYGDDRAPREMFDAVCSTCGKDTQVPFRPTSGKPVYCSDCFRTVRAR
jgi:CxxC-x17-CxxC domain-containing protein